MNHGRQGLVLKYELGFALARPCIFTKVIIDLILIFSLNVELSCVTQKKRLELQTSSRLSLTIIAAGFTADHGFNSKEVCKPENKKYYEY